MSYVSLAKLSVCFEVSDRRSLYCTFNKVDSVNVALFVGFWL